MIGIWNNFILRVNKFNKVLSCFDLFHSNDIYIHIMETNADDNYPTGSKPYILDSYQSKVSYISMPYTNIVIFTQYDE